MAHTLDAVVYDPVSLIVRMIVLVDDDGQLDDPAFNPPDAVHVRIPAVLDALALAGPTSLTMSTSDTSMTPEAVIDATTLALAAAQDQTGLQLQLQPPAPVPDAVAIGA